MVTRKELIEKYRSFFESKGHKWIPSASLVPENDPTVLFTTAGMHPLVPYLIGEPHTEGKRLASVQKCIRTDDIDEVGDKVHHTFFEMLGNWSLGDYFKKESISWSFEFLTSPQWLGLDKNRLGVSVFEGDRDAPFDQESHDIWIGLGIPKERITPLPKSDNWWGPAGATGPCGPDTEIFYWTGEREAPKVFDNTDKRWVEIWNNVFMEYNKKADGTYESLKQKNVDTGIGLARTLTVLNGLDDTFQTEMLKPIISKIEEISGKNYSENEREFRIIADHITAAVFALSDGVLPSNKGSGYVVRRLIRGAIVKANKLGVKENFASDIVTEVAQIYRDSYPALSDPSIAEETAKEEKKFSEALNTGMRYLTSKKTLNGQDLFNLYQTYGFPVEIALEEAAASQIAVDEGVVKDYEGLLREHQERSRTASAGMFKGGLADASEITTKYHTATHLLQAALRKVLGDNVFQKGSNITAERMRFDFSHPEKMTEEQIKEVEDLVNQKIAEDLPVSYEEMTVEEAKKAGALGVFDDRYGTKVKVYSVGPSTGSGSPFSREICGGPHVSHTGEIGHFKIIREEASSAGVRRIKAVVE